MCGIAGIVGPRATAEAVIAMRDTMAHRGPNGAGYFVDGDVAFGHRRLSIIDLSENGSQPMTTADGRFTIIFNGEVYNYRELRKELGEEIPWKSTSDTEVILRAFATWGTTAFQRFNGMFAFAIYDRDERTVMCVRDRLGIKPFYYWSDGTTCFFASEIKALLRAGAPRKPNDARIADYLSYGMYDHTDETFFEGIQKLPAGHYAVLRSGQPLKAIPYWDLPSRVSTLDVPTDDREIVARFEALLKDAIALRLRSDVPVGVNLSSGLDSTTLLAYLQLTQSDLGNIHAFSARYPDDRFDEGQFIEPLVNEFGTPWHTTTLALNDVESVCANVLDAQDEPFGGIPQLGFYQLSKLEREAGVPVLLEGHGVEEYLTGYPIFFPPYWSDLARAGKVATLVHELRAYAAQGRGSIRTALSQWWSYATARNTMHLDLTTQAGDSVVPAGYVAAHRQPIETRTPFPTQLENALYRNLTQTKLPRVLRFQDRMSMAHGRELRLPFLDYRLVEFVYALPGRQKIRDGEDKYLMRQAVKQVVKPEILNRKKSYVVTPQTAWLHGPLRHLLTETVASASFRSRPCFDPAAAERRVSSFLADPHPKNSFAVWQLFNLESWFRRFIDG